MSQSAFTHPALALLRNLLGTVGVPFFVVSTTAPLLQNWLSRTADRASKDPYFLYAASNTGSLLALLIYPFWVEPRIGAAAQSGIWTTGYEVTIALILISAAMIWKASTASNSREEISEELLEPPPTWRMRLFWVIPAFIASGLMLAVTNHITSDLASAPFLWICPLAIYLLTFIVAFSQRLRFGSARVSRLIPVVLLALFPFVCGDVIAQPGLNWFLIAAHLGLLYAGALLCHARLAESRPDSRFLTEFYFWVALGGVLGGVFTATIAPWCFQQSSNTRSWLPLSRSFAHRPTPRNGRPMRTGPYPALVAVGIAIVWLIFRKTGIDSDITVPALAHTILLFIAYKFRTRPFRFALTLTIFIIAYSIVLPQYIEGADRVYVTRNFFGVKKILMNGPLRSLRHGDTTHGTENTLHPGEPTSYYHPTGTLGHVMNRMGKSLDRIGVIGLGTGSMAGYTRPGRHITFYDIEGRSNRSRETTSRSSRNAARTVRL